MVPQHHYTVWKLKNLPVTQNLRQFNLGQLFVTPILINSGEFEITKIAISTIVEVHDFDFEKYCNWK